MRIKTFWLMSIVIVAAISNVLAQSPAPSISNAHLLETNGVQKIVITFSASLDKEDEAAARNADNYFVIDVKGRKTIELQNISLKARALKRSDPARPPASPPIPLLTITVEFDVVPKVDPSTGIVDRINLDETGALYFVTAANLTFGNKPVKGMLQAKLEKPPSGLPSAGLPAGTTNPTPHPFVFSKSKGRQDSNIYIAGEVSGASGKGPFTSLDAKFLLPFLVKEFRGRVHTFSPFFDLRASTNPSSDPDSANMGLLWEWPVLPGSGGVFGDLFWENSGKFEAQRDFENNNIVWESRFVATLNLLNNEKTQIFLDPFLGTELGTNLDSPVKEAEGRAVSRVFAGATLSLIPFRRRESTDIISLEASYIRRWPLKEEVSFTEDKDGNLKPLFIGTSPREFVDTKVNFQFNNFFGVFAGYEYGELPPSYKLIDHRFRIGLVYKAKIDR